MELAAPIVPWHPSRDESCSSLGIACFVIAVREGVRPPRIARIEGQGSLDLGNAGGNVAAALDTGPTEEGQKEPVLAPLRCKALQHRQLGLAVIVASAEPEQAERAQRQEQRQRVARVFGQVLRA